MLILGAHNLQELVLIWNRIFPIDRWYRKQHHIAFNSKAHRESNFVDMYFEYLEFYMFEYTQQRKELINAKRNRKDLERFDEQKQGYVKGSGRIMKEVVWTQHDIDAAFDALDIDNME